MFGQHPRRLYAKIEWSEKSPEFRNKQDRGIENFDQNDAQLSTSYHLHFAAFMFDNRTSIGLPWKHKRHDQYKTSSPNKFDRSTAILFTKLTLSLKFVSETPAPVGCAPAIAIV
jgi:hypothetical protein